MRGDNRARASRNANHGQTMQRGGFAIRVEVDGIYGTRQRRRYVGRGKQGRAPLEVELAADVRLAIKELHDVLSLLGEPPAGERELREWRKSISARIALAGRMTSDIPDRAEARRLKREAQKREREREREREQAVAP